MKDLGINLIGELVPYLDGWNGYSSPEFSDLLDVAGRYNMILCLVIETLVAVVLLIISIPMWKKVIGNNED